MAPILLKIGQQPVSSFGLFLLIAFLVASYTIWRLIRVYELDEEKTIDLILLTIFSSLIFARIYFVIFHLPEFNTWDKILFINKYPGISFWGALMGGFIALKLISYRMKVNFWQISDIGIIGLFAGLVVGSFGCLLGSCQYGQTSNLPFAVSQIGLIGKRFPLQVIEGFLFFLSYIYLWRASLKFHKNGQILAKGLLILSLIKLFLEPLRGDQQKIIFNLSLGYVWSVLLLIFALKLYYVQSKKSFREDLNFFLSIFYKSNKRRLLFTKIYKDLYNFKINFKFQVIKFKKNLTKKFNVKSTPPQF